MTIDDRGLISWLGLFFDKLGIFLFFTFSDKNTDIYLIIFILHAFSATARNDDIKACYHGYRVLKG